VRPPGGSCDVRLQQKQQRRQRRKRRRTNDVTFIAPVLAAAGAAAAIIAAPTTLAADTQSCSFTGSGTVCESPGNVQVNSAPVDQPYPFYPFYDYAEGDFYHGGYGRGHR
jgi:hypothetical protein